MKYLVHSEKEKIGLFRSNLWRKTKCLMHLIFSGCPRSMLRSNPLSLYNLQAHMVLNFAEEITVCADALIIM
jgi:hypothetical protein